MRYLRMGEACVGMRVYVKGPSRPLTEITFLPGKITSIFGDGKLPRICTVDLDNRQTIRRLEHFVLVDEPREDALANARLFAAAPELLAALEELVLAADPHTNMSDCVVWDALARARSAIDIARGNEPAGEDR